MPVLHNQSGISPALMIVLVLCHVGEVCHRPVILPYYVIMAGSFEKMTTHNAPVCSVQH